MSLDADDSKKQPSTLKAVTTPSPAAESSPSPQDNLTDSERSAIADFKTGAFSLQAIANRNGFKHKNTVARLIKKVGATPENVGKTAEKRRGLIDQAHRPAVEGDAGRARATQDELDAAAIDAVGRLQADITIVHRRDIKQCRTLLVKLATQLETAMNSETAMKQVRDLLKAGGIEGKEVDEKLSIMSAAMNMRGRSEILRNMSMAFKNVIPLERTAYGLDTGAGNPADHVPLEERVKAWTSKEQPLPANVTALHLKTETA